MADDPMRGGPAVKAPCRAVHARVLLLALAASLLVGCSRSAAPKPDPSPGADGVSLTQEQRTPVNLYKVTPLRYQRTVDASGVVDFDNDQSTSVLAPFSGPVSRLLVPLGAEVTEGEPLAVVESPDFATAMSTY